MDDIAPFDVFLSYSSRRHARSARNLYRVLTEQGYRVWFDEHVLRGKFAWVPVDRRTIMSALEAGIDRSRALVLFEMAMEAIHPGAGVDAEAAIATHQCMRDADGRLIAWNWQMFEAQHASIPRIVVYERDGWRGVPTELRARGIKPIPPAPPKDERGLWRRFADHLNTLAEPPVPTERERVAAQFSTLPVDDRDGGTSKTIDMEILMSLVFGLARIGMSAFQEKICFIAPRGCGRTTTLQWVARRVRKYLSRECVFAALPEEKDVGTWMMHLQSLDLNGLLLIEDFGKQILTMRQTAAQHLYQGFFRLAQDRLGMILVMTEAEAREILHIDHKEFRVSPGSIPGLGTVEVVRHTPLDCCQVSKILEQRIGQLEREKDLTVALQYWAQYSLARRAEYFPFFDEVRPVDYESLEGDTVAEPKKSLKLLDEAVRQAELAGTDGARLLNDQAFERAMHVCTGFPEPMFFSSMLGEDDVRMRTRMEFRQSLAADLRLKGAEMWWLRYSMMESLMVHPTTNFVRSRELRRSVCEKLALGLFGTSKAVLRIDYDTLREQSLDGFSPSESLLGIVRAAKRYPFWVMEFSGIERAPPRDHSLLRNMISQEGVDESPFRRCIFIYDSNPKFLQWTIEELEPCH